MVAGGKMFKSQFWKSASPRKNEFQKARLMGEDVPSASEKQNSKARLGIFFRKCIDSDNARLYGSFDQRAALNITQFLKIQLSMFIRMGAVYPITSYLVEKIGIPAIRGACSHFAGWLDRLEALGQGA
jgi:hypothetical protein